MLLVSATLEHFDPCNILRHLNQHQSSMNVIIFSNEKTDMGI